MDYHLVGGSRWVCLSIYSITLFSYSTYLGILSPWPWPLKDTGNPGWAYRGACYTIHLQFCQSYVNPMPPSGPPAYTNIWQVPMRYTVRKTIERFWIIWRQFKQAVTIWKTLRWSSEGHMIIKLVYFYAAPLTLAHNWSATCMWTNGT
jgi:hypothetical protein